MKVISGQLLQRSFSVEHRDSRRSWSAREGLIVVLRSDHHVGVGEASPLPGYSADTLETCRAELSGVWQRVEPIDEAAPILSTMTQVCERASVRSAAAIFALETAVLDLVARARGVSAWSLLRDGEEAQPVPISGIIDGDGPDALKRAADATLARGIRVLKLKIGIPGGDGHDDARLAALRAHVGGAAHLRLDANQALDETTLSSRLEALRVFAPELLEEPSAMSAWDTIENSPIPLAMDESLMQVGWHERLESAASRSACSAVVLKPMALGGFARCLEIAEAAARLELGSLVTHVFDGPVGSAAAACLALAIRGKTLACGLDAHDRFPDGPRPIAIAGSRIEPFDAPGIGIDVESLA